MLWVASIVTIGMLISIIGYILFKGFVSDKRSEYRVIGNAEEIFHRGEESDIPIAVIVNKKVKLHDITVEKLRAVFMGAKTNWGLISEQDIPIRIFAYRHETEIGEAFDHSVLRNAPFKDTIQFVDSNEAMIAAVEARKGGIGYITGEGIELVDDAKARVVPVRSIAIVANAGALELRENLKLRYLADAQLGKIFSGTVRNWKEVGGHDMSMRVVGYKADTQLQKDFSRLILDGDPIKPIITVHSFAGHMDTIEKVEGSIGFCKYSDAMQIKDNIVKIERRLKKPNLNLDFLIKPPKRAGVVGGVSSVIMNTVFMILLTLIFSTPIGILAAIFLTEYSRALFSRSEGRSVRRRRSSSPWEPITGWQRTSPRPQERSRYISTYW